MWAMRERIIDSGNLRACGRASSSAAETPGGALPAAPSASSRSILSFLRGIGGRGYPPLSVLFKEAGPDTEGTRGTIRHDRCGLDTVNGVCPFGMRGRIHPPRYGKPERLGHDGNFNARHIRLVVHSPSGRLGSVSNRLPSYPLIFIPQCTVEQIRLPRLFIPHITSEPVGACDCKHPPDGEFRTTGPLCRGRVRVWVRCAEVGKTGKNIGVRFETIGRNLSIREHV